MSFRVGDLKRYCVFTGIQSNYLINGVASHISYNVFRRKLVLLISFAQNQSVAHHSPGVHNMKFAPFLLDLCSGEYSAPI